MDFPEVLTTTQLADFASCERRWAYLWLRGGGAAPPSPHQLVGAAFARALDTWRKARMSNLPLPERRAFAALLSAPEWSLLPNPPTGKNAARALISLENYITRFADDEIEGSEFTFTIPLHPDILHPQTGDPILIESRFDAVVRRSDALWVLDDKTTNRLGPTWASQWSLRSQLLCYVWAALESGINVRGFFVRGIKLSTGEIAESPLLPTPLWLVAEWYEATCQRARRMIEIFREFEGALPAFGDACNAYGGCPLRTLCLTPPEGRDKALEAVLDGGS